MEKTIKKIARALGADVVGIGNIERWQGAPTQMDPRQIMPEAKSVIGMVFRVMRGSLRGIEEGTFFSNYSAMGYGGLTYLYIPMVVMNLCKKIEDAGFEALPMGHQSDWRAIDNEGFLRPNCSRPVAPGRAAPDIMVHLRIAAYLCGLGEIGYSKMFLSPQFGPRNRVGIVITDAKLKPDPIYAGPKLCNRCMACVKLCPGNAIHSKKTVKVKLAGREVEWGDLDYLIVDLPPGTGDVHLTLVQSVSVTGAVLVSTPQDVGLIISMKTLRMFQSANVRVLGVIENMSFHVCSQCGSREEIFGHGGVAQAAVRLGIPFLGEIPLDARICKQADLGVPMILAEPQAPGSLAYRSVLEKLAAQVSIASFEDSKIEVIEEPAGPSKGATPSKQAWPV